MWMRCVFDSQQQGAFVWCSRGSSDFHGHIIELN